MTERLEHRWVMVRAWVVEADLAAQLAEGGAFRSEGPGELTGPLCGACHQGYEASPWPCPGRIWTEDDKPRRIGMDALPRAERRRRTLEERRRQSRIRDCQHLEAHKRWTNTAAGPKQITECVDCGTPMIATAGVRLSHPGQPLISPRR
jgi:hypothetical protein